MESMRYLFHRLFPLSLPEDHGSVDQALLHVLCVAMIIDGKISAEEISDAVHIVEQLYSFEEYEGEQEIRVLLEETITHVTHTGPHLALKAAAENLPNVADRERALQLVAYINDSDEQVVPIETALIDLAAKTFGIDQDRVMELLKELDSSVSRTRAQVERLSKPQTAKNNPFLAYEELPRFDEVEAWQLEPAVEVLLPELKAAFTELEIREEQDVSFDVLIDDYNRLGDRLSFTWRLAGHLLGVNNGDELRDAYERVQAPLVAFSVEMGQSRPLYEKFLKIQALESLTEPQRRIVDGLVLSAKHSGVGLDGDAKARFNAIQGELAALSTKFSNNVLDSTKAFEMILTEQDDVDGLESSFLKMAAQSARQAGHEEASAEDGPWRITLDVPSAFPVLRHARDRNLRESVYRAYTTRASTGDKDNTDLIKKILRLRKEEADILGYDNFASMSLSAKMADDVAAVEGLLDELRTASWDAAEQDHQQLIDFASEQGFEGELKHWDVNFWSERLRETRYGYKDEEIRPYFPFPRVLDGFFLLIKELFGVRVVPTPVDDVQVWHEDVRFYKVYDDEEHIASFFLDPYSRPATKRGGAWHGTCQARNISGGELDLPVSYLVCNQTPPVDGQPSLMTFREVTTLFHEFGHGLQHMLTRVNYGMASGISNVEWDAVELPSQFMENWCYQPEILKSLTGHVDTGESLPEHYLNKIIEAKNFQAGSGMLRQIYFGLLDMTLHSSYDPDDADAPDLFEVQRDVSLKTSVMEPFEENRFLCSFSHIFAGGYAAGYYSYKWAEVLSADAFAAFEEAGLDDSEAVRETGKRFRETVLALGGGRDPMLVFKDFRGREPEPDALLRHNGLIAAAE